MNETLKRLPKLGLGLLFRRRGIVVGGERLLVYGRIRVSSPGGGGRIVLGERVKLGRRMGLFLDSPEARIEIGSFTGLNRRTEICAMDAVHIGERCAIGWDVCITDTDYHEFEGMKRTAPVRIGDDVWIGSRATILKGVTIGDGAVIGAGAVITRDVPPAALVTAAPSGVVRENVSWSI
jgi:acetyltransferase-like isoleucine patch superfamily enzyme